MIPKAESAAVPPRRGLARKYQPSRQLLRRQCAVDRHLDLTRIQSRDAFAADPRHTGERGTQTSPVDRGEDRLASGNFYGVLPLIEFDGHRPRGRLRGRIEFRFHESAVPSISIH